MSRCAALVFAAALAGCATAPKADEARAYLDRAEPLHCEVVALEARLKAVPENDGRYTALNGELAQAKANVKAYYQATWPEYMAILLELPLEERQKIYAYSDSVGERCAAKAGKSSGSP